MKKFILGLSYILIVFSYSSNAKTQKNTVKPLYLEELNYWYYDPVVNKSVTKKLSDSTSIKITLKSYKGALSFEIYNLKHELVRKGSYCDALDVFKHYVRLIDISNLRDKVIVKEHYQPLPDGQWLTFSKGKVIDRVRYSKGVIKI